MLTDIRWVLPAYFDETDGTVYHRVPPTPTDRYTVRITDPKVAERPESAVHERHKTRCFIMLNRIRPPTERIVFDFGPLLPTHDADGVRTSHAQVVGAALSVISEMDTVLQAAICTLDGESLAAIDPQTHVHVDSRHITLVAHRSRMYDVRVFLVRRGYVVRDDLLCLRKLHIAPMETPQLIKKANKIVLRLHTLGVPHSEIIAQFEQPLRSYIVTAIEKVPLQQPHVGPLPLAKPTMMTQRAASGPTGMGKNGPRILSDEQMIQMADAYYWSKLAPDGERCDDYDIVIRYYKRNGIEVRLKNPHERTINNTTRVSTRPTGLAAVPYVAPSAAHIARASSGGTSLLGATATTTTTRGRKKGKGLPVKRKNKDPDVASDTQDVVAHVHAMQPDASLRVHTLSPHLAPDVAFVAPTQAPVQVSPHQQAPISPQFQSARALDEHRAQIPDPESARTVGERTKSALPAPPPQPSVRAPLLAGESRTSMADIIMAQSSPLMDVAFPTSYDFLASPDNGHGAGSPRVALRANSVRTSPRPSHVKRASTLAGSGAISSSSSSSATAMTTISKRIVRPPASRTSLSSVVTSAAVRGRGSAHHKTAGGNKAPAGPADAGKPTRGAKRGRPPKTARTAPPVVRSPAHQPATTTTEATKEPPHAVVPPCDPPVETEQTDKSEQTCVAVGAEALDRAHDQDNIVSDAERATGIVEPESKRLCTSSRKGAEEATHDADRAAPTVVPVTEPSATEDAAPVTAAAQEPDVVAARDDTHVAPVASPPLGIATAAIIQDPASAVSAETTPHTENAIVGSVPDSAPLAPPDECPLNMALEPHAPQDIVLAAGAEPSEDVGAWVPRERTEDTAFGNYMPVSPVRVMPPCEPTTMESEDAGQGHDATHQPQHLFTEGVLDHVLLALDSVPVGCASAPPVLDPPPPPLPHDVAVGEVESVAKHADGDAPRDTNTAAVVAPSDSICALDSSLLPAPHVSVCNTSIDVVLQDAARSQDDTLDPLDVSLAECAEPSADGCLDRTAGPSEAVASHASAERIEASAREGPTRRTQKKCVRFAIDPPREPPPPPPEYHPSDPKAPPYAVTPNFVRIPCHVDMRDGHARILLQQVVSQSAIAPAATPSASVPDTIATAAASPEPADRASFLYPSEVQQQQNLPSRYDAYIGGGREAAQARHVEYEQRQWWHATVPFNGAPPSHQQHEHAWYDNGSHPTTAERQHVDRPSHHLARVHAESARYNRIAEMQRGPSPYPYDHGDGHHQPPTAPMETHDATPKARHTLDASWPLYRQPPRPGQADSMSDHDKYRRQAIHALYQQQQQKCLAQAMQAAEQNLYHPSAEQCDSSGPLQRATQTRQQQQQQPTHFVGTSPSLPALSMPPYVPLEVVPDAVPRYRNAETRAPDTMVRGGHVIDRAPLSSSSPPVERENAIYAQQQQQQQQQQRTLEQRRADGHTVQRAAKKGEDDWDAYAAPSRPPHRSVNMPDVDPHGRALPSSGGVHSLRAIAALERSSIYAPVPSPHQPHPQQRPAEHGRHQQHQQSSYSGGGQPSVDTHPQPPYGTAGFGHTWYARDKAAAAGDVPDSRTQRMGARALPPTMHYTPYQQQHAYPPPPQDAVWHTFSGTPSHGYRFMPQGGPPGGSDSSSASAPPPAHLGNTYPRFG